MTNHRTAIEEHSDELAFTLQHKNDAIVDMML